jgi:transposase
MAALWKIESDIRGLAPAARMAARQQRSATMVAELFDLWEMELPRISGKSKLAEAIRYATSRRKVLECFLIDGRVEIDSNIVERAIRPQTITRKNALFAGSDGGGRTWATIATLLQTAKMNDVEPASSVLSPTVCLNLAAARLRYIAGTTWSAKCYMNMRP